MIYFVRHGESEANVANIFSGPDTPLTKHGHQQARGVGKKIIAENIIIDRIIASTYERAVDTAKIIAQTINFDENLIQYDYRLVEWNAGELINTSEKGITKKDTINAKGAEQYSSMLRRISAAYNEIKSLPGNTLIVSHCGVGQMIQIMKQGLDPNDCYSIEKPPNGEIMVISD